MLPYDERTYQLPEKTHRGQTTKQARTITLGRAVRPELLKHIQDDLTDHEDRVEYLMRRNIMEAVQLLLAPSIFVLIVAAALVFFEIAFWIISLVIGLAAAGLWILFTYWRRSVICVTSQSVILKHDFPFIGDFHSMPLNKVSSAMSYRRFWGQIFGYKSVKIDGPGQQDQIFNYIPYVAQADEMVRAIRSQQGSS